LGSAALNFTATLEELCQNKNITIIVGFLQKNFHEKFQFSLKNGSAQLAQEKLLASSAQGKFLASSALFFKIFNSALICLGNLSLSHLS